MSLYLYDHIPLSLFILLGTVTVIQLYYLLWVYSRLSGYRVPASDGEVFCPPVSVVICARNEEENLRQHLPAILQQNYPSFEVVLVNDYSEDETKWMLKELCKEYPQLKVVDIAQHVRLKHGKKFAVTLGIKAATNEYIVFTDADCKPQSSDWLRHMAQGFSEGREIVLGYSPYDRRPGVLNAFIRFETFHTAISYLSYALKGDPYMGVGRNLAYTKSLFFRGKGFAAHMHIPSGDDDLFVNQNAAAVNTSICIHPDAQVWSAPKTTFSAYYRQKTRHNGASRAYKRRHQFMLSWQAGSALFFYLALAAVFVFCPQYWQYAAGAWFLRLLVQIVVYYPAMKKLQVPGLIWWLPLLDISYYFFISINGLLSRFRKDVRWK